MKKLAKWLLIGFGVFIALIVVVAALSDSPEEAKEEAVETTQPVTSEVTTETKEESKEEVADGTGITLENFNKLETGMTYEEVVAILGSEGEIMSESEVAGIKTTMYTWDANSFGANMNIMIQDDGLISKAQLGLK